MKNILLLLISFLFIVLSCKKEGCTDENATNTTAGAEKDDGTCAYESTVVFWHTATTRTVMNNNGISSLNYFLDGTLLGTKGTTTVYSSAPDCSVTTAFVRSIAYDESPSKNLSYEVKSQAGQLVFSGTIAFMNGECISQELHY